MKILVLQLARFGDIFQTWPCLSALRRKYPEAEIQFAVRERYQAAAENLTAVDKLVSLPTKSILSPLIFSEEGIEDSLIEMDRYIDSFDSDYDQIINLSFSPFSSYLVDEIKSENTEVMGYDRFEDGFLKIADDSSAYFYAQVGVGRFNRLHLVDIFAMVAGVELEPQDFQHPSSQNPTREDRPYYVIHVGASRSFKTCTSESWEAILRILLKKTDHIVYLVGTKEEKLNSEWIKTQNRIVDLCGETSIDDLFPMVAGADALIAGDSMLVQVANLTNTKCLNVSFPTVNFWETGPRVPGSRVVFFKDVENVNTQMLCDQLAYLGTEENMLSNVYLCKPQNHVLYQYTQATEDEFQWALIRAMYMGFDYPIAEKVDIAIAQSKIHELALLGIENLKEVQKNPQNHVSMGILDEVDQLMVEIGRRNSESQPLVKWFLSEKSRIGPGAFEDILDQTINVYEQLKVVSNLYTMEEEIPVEVERRDLTWK